MERAPPVEVPTAVPGISQALASQQCLLPRSLFQPTQRGKLSLRTSSSKSAGSSRPSVFMGWTGARSLS